jgi:hypothetical protein
MMMNKWGVGMGFYTAALPGSVHGDLGYEVAFRRVL